MAELRLRPMLQAPTAFDRSAVCWRINRTPCWPSQKQLDGDLRALVEEFAVPGHALVKEVRSVLSLPSRRPEQWQREQGYWAAGAARFGKYAEAVEELLGQVVDASSVIKATE